MPVILIPRYLPVSSRSQVHVNMMISEARLQAELLYALRTIMRYMT